MPGQINWENMSIIQIVSMVLRQSSENRKIFVDALRIEQELGETIGDQSEARDAREENIRGILGDKTDAVLEMFRSNPKLMDMLKALMEKYGQNGLSVLLGAAMNGDAPMDAAFGAFWALGQLLGGTIVLKDGTQMKVSDAIRTVVEALESVGIDWEGNPDGGKLFVELAGWAEAETKLADLRREYDEAVPERVRERLGMDAENANGELTDAIMAGYNNALGELEETDRTMLRGTQVISQLTRGVVNELS